MSEKGMEPEAKDSNAEENPVEGEVPNLDTAQTEAGANVEGADVLSMTTEQKRAKLESAAGKSQGSAVSKHTGDDSKSSNGSQKSKKEEKLERDSNQIYLELEAFPELDKKGMEYADEIVLNIMDKLKYALGIDYNEDSHW